MKKIQQENIFIRLIAYLVITYYKVLNFFTHKDYFNRTHFEIVFENWAFRVKWYSHDDYIAHKLTLLNYAKKELAPHEFITFLFKQCRHCNFVIFNCKDEKRFIQFWLGDGKLMADWPILKQNGMEKYRYAMLGVLNELDIHEVKEDQTKPKRIPYYILKNYADYKSYEIYFQEYQNEATTFISMMLTDVYKQNLDDLVFQIQ